MDRLGDADLNDSLTPTYAINVANLGFEAR